MDIVEIALHTRPSAMSFFSIKRKVVVLFLCCCSTALLFPSCVENSVCAKLLCKEITSQVSVPLPSPSFSFTLSEEQVISECCCNIMTIA